MAHNREKKSLYEVMSKGNLSKPHADKDLEPSSQMEEPVRKDEHPVAKLAAPGRVRWLNRPRVVQINSGRIEISLPYQLAIAVLLGIVLMVLVVFRLGQMTYRSSSEETGSGAQMLENGQRAATKTEAFVPQKSAPDEREITMSPVKSKGDNRIVIQSYQVRADLEPVKQYFAGFGIETEIRKIDDWYYLVTKDKYENPGRPGTDGYLARQRIVELGARYKAPPGNETFGSQPFSDAYGKKFDD